MKIIYMGQTINMLAQIKLNEGDKDSVKTLVDSGEVKETASGLKYLVIEIIRSYLDKYLIYILIQFRLIF